MFWKTQIADDSISNSMTINDYIVESIKLLNESRIKTKAYIFNNI